MSVSFRLTCCLCRRDIPLAQDVRELDAEWQRRFPDMLGTLACERCAEHTYWSCEKTGLREYVEGHIPTSDGNCFDAWSHVGRSGTHRAMVLSCPQPALLQGAEPYLRSVANHGRVSSEIVTAVRAALREWEAQHGRAHTRQAMSV